jgi:hypothetical protein
MELDRRQQTPVQRNLHRMHLCLQVLEEVQQDLERPELVDERADLLLVSEKLSSEIGQLYRRIYVFAWDEEYDPEQPIKTEE